jgi:inward rectifier potassium channel
VTAESNATKVGASLNASTSVTSAPSATVRSSTFREGELRFESRGARVSPFVDLYHSLLRASWGQLFLTYFAVYLAENALFAALYWLGGDGTILNAQGHAFLECFWFSVQTLATIGYGFYAPNSTYAHVLVTLESFVGLLTTALTTGLLFAKFSKPVARVKFSRNALFSVRNGEMAFTFRVANQRKTALLESSLKVHVLKDEVSAEGHQMRRAHELKLERSEIPVFRLSWALLHPVTPESPLAGITADNVSQHLVSIIVSFSGTDDTLSQTVRARRIYTPEDMRFGYRFVDMIDSSVDGMLIVDHSKLDEIAAL